MLGRTPGNIVAIRPMSDGVIADYTTTQKMLEYIFAKVVGRKRLFKPRVLVCVPSQVTSVEKRAVRHAALEAGASEAHTIEEPMAAAIGAGLPISMPGGNMVVDIGGGTTDIAVISLEGIVTSESLRVAGNRMDEVIIRHVKSMYSLMIGDRTAEEIKVKVGSAYALEQELSLEVRGRDLVAGLPKTVSVTSVEVREALAEAGACDCGESKAGVGADAAGTRRRHHRARHCADRRGRVAARLRPSAVRRNEHPRLRRGRPAFLRRHRHGPRPRRIPRHSRQRTVQQRPMSREEDRNRKQKTEAMPRHCKLAANAQAFQTLPALFCFLFSVFCLLSSVFCFLFSVFSLSSRRRPAICRVRTGRRAR